MTDDSGAFLGRVGDGEASANALDAALARLGYDAFKPGQREAVETLLETGRLLLVAPTGGGKSLTYQLPATLLGGTTLVVSPLISLMQDQVDALTERGVAATYLASTLDFGEQRRRMQAIRNGEMSLVYAAPERLAGGPSGDEMRALLHDLDCPLIAIDEAHCISEWGHDFRPEYMALGALLADFPKARVLACTATATPVVRDEILVRLGLPADTPQLVRGFARPNLALRAREVRHKKDLRGWIDDALREALVDPAHPNGAAILYAPTRKSTEGEAARLERAGWKALAYHAGMSGRDRERIHRSFASGEADVVVATNAFGMGIDRADVRAVVHLAPPGSVESYYQEVGRAGRDDQPAIGLLLVSPGDMAQRRALIERDAAGGAASQELVRHKWNLFLELMRWAEGGSCRHDAILRYFDDEEETLAGCGRCDVCLGLAASVADEEERTLLVRKALSGVARIHGRFGLMAAVKLLRGAEDERLERAGLQRTSTFGVLSEHAEEWLQRLLRRCVTAGWVEFEGGDRPVAVLTEEGIAVMRAERPARLLLPAIDLGRPGRVPKAGRREAPIRHETGETRPARTALEGEDILDETGQALFEALRQYRLTVSKADEVPPYVVATDRALRDIARLRPRDEYELLQAHGIGPSKVERYGAGLLSVVEDATVDLFSAGPDPEEE